MSNTPFYTKTETDYKVQDAKSQAYLGIATTTTVPPATGAYWYRVNTAGTYTNFLSGGSPIVVSSTDFKSVSGKYFNVTIEVKDNVCTKVITEALDTTEYLSDYAKENDIKKIVGIEPIINIADLSKIKEGYYFNHADGNTYPINGQNALGKYPIEPNTEYQVPSTYTDQTAFFDENLNFIGGIAQVNPSTQKFTTPANAAFIGMSVKDQHLATFMLAKSSEYPDSYVPYEEKLKNVSIETEQVNNLYKKVRNDLGFFTINIIDKAKIVYDKYFNYSNGQLANAAGYVALGKYPIEGGIEYQISSFQTDQIAFFDANNTFISGIANVGATHKFVTPANAAFIGVSAKPSQVDSLVLAKSSEFPVNYIPFKLDIPSLKLETEQVIRLYEKVRNELGFYNINIIDTNPSKIIYDKYYGYSDGALYDFEGFVALGKYPIKPDTEYRISDFQTDQIAFYNANGVFVSGIAKVDDLTHKFITPTNAAFIGVSAKPHQVNSLVLSETQYYPSSYVPFGVSIKDLMLPKEQYTEIEVSADENDTTQFKGKNAIQEAIDSITDATDTNRYRIIVKKGLYKITQANEFIGNIGYPTMVCPKDYVDIVGQGEDNTIVWAELPYIDANIGESVDGNTYLRDRYQTLYNYAGNVTIKNITFVAKNLRYVNHQDDGKGTNKKRFYENVSFIFMGNKGYLKPFGIGTFSGEETHVIGGKSVSDSGDPCAIHNNVSFKKPSVWSFKNHTFMSMGRTTAIEMQNDGSLLQDTIELIGCNFTGMSYKINYIDVWLRGDLAPKYDNFNHAEWHFSGFGNQPFLFENLVAGYCLRIKSNLTGVNSKVRFDKNSSAYPLLIQNTQSNNDKSLYLKDREYVDGYIVQDGTIGLNGQSWGCKDVSEQAYAYNAGINYTSLGKRLGDCSTENKTLDIIIDGVTKTVVFNKNYTAMTNAQILTEINTAISGSGVADLYIYGRDYYPELPDVLERAYNHSDSQFIPKGTIVTKVNGKVKPANEGDKIVGVALDDIPVSSIDSEGVLKGQGRIMTRGYIWTNPNKAHFVKADNNNPAIGTNFKVVNGQLITDVNGSIKTYIDTGIISINC